MRGNIEKFTPEIETKFQKEEGENEKDSQFKEFLAQQISLPRNEWSEKFRDYVEEKYKKEKEEISEYSPKEQQELIFKRYLKGLGLSEEDLKNKRILDLGCGEQGDFIKECLDKHITQEAYGLDAKIVPELFEGKYKDHFFEGNFESKFPIENFDYIISMGAVEAPSNEIDSRDPEKTLHEALKVLKEQGEIRIYPIRKAPPENKLKGVEFMRKKWMEILKELSVKEKVEWELNPIDIKVAGKNKDVWLEEVLIIKKKT